ncbi:MAG: guanylate kinase [Clostridiales Family XIII bacterium]|jgi:guanylate kinase|nr:guanylate kinase [Clostridiales Family XIII bacterium]
MKKGRLFIISGPSGAGKGTICDRVRAKTDSALSVSVTTRSPRPDEKEGKSYYFISREEFDAMVADDGFLEYADVFDNRYGTPKQPVIDALYAGRDVLLEIDVQGAMQVKANFPEGIFVFVLPPSPAVLRERIIARGTEGAEGIEQRLNEARREVEYLPEYDYVIVNDHIDEAVEQTLAILRAESLRMTSATAKALIEQYRKEEM